METKVREATNNEPWGASTTLMAQIAAGTSNYREREEILSFICRRFTEKAANEWRQIYKSLQLVEYLIKNGSERIIDDMRANISLIQMLKLFHYIDSKGRDQGINVRNRAKNLVALLNDDALIRSERKKAKANAHKFGGLSSNSYGGSSPVSSGGGYGGGDEDFNNRVYGDGGVFGARYDDSAAGYSNGASGGDNNFEEYDVEATPRTSKATTGSSAVHAGSAALPAKSKSKPQPKTPDLLGDLMSFDGAAAGSSAPAAATGGATQNDNEDDDDDDFDDFQSAPLGSASQSDNLASNLANLYVSQPLGASAGMLQPSFSASGPQSGFGVAGTVALHTNYSSPAGFSQQQTLTGPAKASNDAFLSLFSSAKSRTTTAPARTPLQPTQPTQPAVSSLAAKDDDLFGDFSSNTQTQTQTQTQPKSTGDELDLLSF